MSVSAPSGYLRQSIAEGFLGVANAFYAPVVSLHRDVNLGSLHDDPGFRQLLRPKG